MFIICLYTLGYSAYTLGYIPTLEPPATVRVHDNLTLRKHGNKDSYSPERYTSG